MGGILDVISAINQQQQQNPQASGSDILQRIFQAQGNGGASVPNQPNSQINVPFFGQNTQQGPNPALSQGQNQAPQDNELNKTILNLISSHDMSGPEEYIKNRMEQTFGSGKKGLAGKMLVALLGGATPLRQRYMQEYELAQKDYQEKIQAALAAQNAQIMAQYRFGQNAINQQNANTRQFAANDTSIYRQGRLQALNKRNDIMQQMTDANVDLAQKKGLDLDQKIRLDTIAANLSEALPIPKGIGPEGSFAYLMSELQGNPQTEGFANNVLSNVEALRYFNAALKKRYTMSASGQDQATGANISRHESGPDLSGLSVPSPIQGAQPPNINPQQPNINPTSGQLPQAQPQATQTPQNIIDQTRQAITKAPSAPIPVPSNKPNVPATPSTVSPTINRHVQAGNVQVNDQGKLQATSPFASLTKGMIKPISQATAVKEGGEAAAEMNTLSVLKDLYGFENTNPSLSARGFIALANDWTNSHNPVKVAIGNFIQKNMDPNTKDISAAFSSMKEHINTLRGPLGATGFRMLESYINLLAQGGSALQNPEVSKDLLRRTAQALLAQHVIRRKQLQPSDPNMWSMLPDKDIVSLYRIASDKPGISSEARKQAAVQLMKQHGWITQ